MTDSTTSSFEPIMAGAMSAAATAAPAAPAKPKYGKSENVDVELALAHRAERTLLSLLARTERST